MSVYAELRKRQCSAMDDAALIDFARDCATQMRSSSPSAREAAALKYQIAWDELKSRNLHLREA